MPELSTHEPWPGLDSFHESQAGFFFGRRQMVGKLVQLVERNSLGVLFGLSGLGKTSLLRAGLFPELRQRRWLPVYLRLDYAANALPPLQQLREVLTASAKAAEIEVPASKGGETLWEYLHRNGNALWNQRSELVTPVFVLDQFEELFTLGTGSTWSAQERGEFLEFLSDLAAGAPPLALREKFEARPELQESFSLTRIPARVLLSLREDYLAELEGLRGDFRNITRSRLRLLPLDGEAALEAVLEPGEGVVGKEVAEKIVRFVAAANAGKGDSSLTALKVEPALLSVVCRELNRRRIELAQPLITAELLTGNQTAILEDFYERAVAGQSASVREYIEEELLTRSGHRDSRAVEDALARPGFTAAILDQLVEQRLLRVEDRGGVPRLELTHDRLAGVIFSSRDRRREREREADAARREKELKKRLAKTRAISLGFAALGLVALAAAGIAVWKADEARRQAERALRNRELAVSSQVDAQASYGKASAAAAKAMWQVGEAEFTAGRKPMALAIMAAAVRLDGQLATQALTKINTLKWPLPLLPPVELGEAPKHLVFSEDGKLLAVAGPSGLRIYAWSERSLRCGPIEHDGGAPSFSPDGSKVLAIAQNGKVRVLDTATGRSLAEMNAPDGAAHEARFAEGGRKIVVSSGEKVSWLDAISGQPTEPGVPPAEAVAGDVKSPLGDHVFYDGPCAAVARSLDGNIATANQMGELLVWGLCPVPSTLGDHKQGAALLEAVGGLRVAESGTLEPTPWEVRLEARKMLEEEK